MSRSADMPAHRSRCPRGMRNARVPKEAWRYLKSHARTPAGWGYSASVPRDADSTAWALLLAPRIGEGGPLPSDEATAFLRRSQVPGSVGTYATAGDIREYVEATGCTDFCGWSAAHDCVTGQRPPSLCFTRRARTRHSRGPTGQRLVAKLLVVRGCLRHGHVRPQLSSDVRSPEARRAIARAGVWAELKVQSRAGASPFAAGLLLILVSYGPQGANSCSTRLCEELLANQGESRRVFSSHGPPPNTAAERGKIRARLVVGALVGPRNAVRYLLDRPRKCLYHSNGLFRACRMMSRQQA